MEYLFPSEPLDKRLKISLDYNKEIVFFGQDNIYPQRMDEVRLRSPLIKSATHILEDFINGSGWELNNDIVLNQRGETGRDILNLTAMDFSRWNGFALHLNFDGRGRITEIQHIPWEYCRLGMPDDFGNISTIAVSNNWEEDTHKLPQGYTPYEEIFPIFNPLRAADETVFIPQPQGQILYYTGLERNKYPLATFDSIRDTAETDAAVQKYERNNTNKGFHGATIFKYPGEFTSDAQKYEIMNMVKGWLGPDGPGITVAQIDEDFTGSLMEQVPSDSDDALFSLTLDSILNRTLQHYNIPPALYGVAPTGGVFTQLAYQESFIVYNVITRNKRSAVSRVFNKLANLWHQQAFSFGRILENEFAVQEVANEKIANRLTGPTDQQLAEQAVATPAPSQGGDFNTNNNAPIN
jgi:hypothetical protein